MEKGVDPELFQKYQQNMRVEHLLLEKEVSDIMSRIQTSASNDLSLTQLSYSSASS